MQCDEDNRKVRVLDTHKMRFSWSAIILIICIVIFSIFVANVANLINIDRNLSKKLNAAMTLQDDENPHHPRYVQMDDSPNHLMWFLQVIRSR